MKVTVTAGHGEGDPGAVRFGLNEAVLMAELRDLVAARLREMGHQVRADGEGKVNRALTYALTLVPGSGIAVDLHTNAHENPAATGVEVVSRPEHKAKAQHIARSIANALGLPLRGSGGWRAENETAKKRLAYLAAGGLVVEVFFLSNPNDLAAYMSRKHSVAYAIASALVPAT